MYADKITKAMDLTINETNRRRDKQKEYNKLNSIIPTQINKSNENDLLIGRKKESNEINDLVFTKDFSIEDPAMELEDMTHFKLLATSFPSKQSINL